MSARIYLDGNATAPVRAEAAAAVAVAFAGWANPSSAHAAGRAARAAVEAARVDLAALIGADPRGVIFTSGGAEANAQAILGARAHDLERIILGATEHETVVENAAAAGLPVETWPVDGEGRAVLPWLADRLARGPRALVCLMLANNETGVIQPVAEAADLVRAAGGWLHVDAVQALGKIAIDFGELSADTLALSSHKLGGPPGVGALVARSGLRPARLIHGGGQEDELRAGTVNAPGIAGFAAAAHAAVRELPVVARQAGWRATAEARLEAEGAVVLGKGAPRLPQTLCIAMPGFSSELQVMALDLAGVMVSAGAACSSGRIKASRVVAAMGRPDLAPCSIRVSGGWATGEADWVAFVDAWLAARRRHADRRVLERAA